MNTTLTTERRHAPPENQTDQHTTDRHHTRTLSLLERAALHLGLALIRWGRRPGRELARYERRANSYEQNLAHLQHEAAVAAHENARTRSILLSIR